MSARRAAFLPGVVGAGPSLGCSGTTRTDRSNEPQRPPPSQFILVHGRLKGGSVSSLAFAPWVNARALPRGRMDEFRERD